MDDFEKLLNDAEREGIKMTQGLSRLLLGMWKSAQDDMKAATNAARRLSVVSIISAVLAISSLCVCCFMGADLQRQGGEIRAIHRVLDEGVVIEETTTTTETTTTVEQDTGEGSGNNVFQAGENSTYTQNGGGE